MAAITVTMAVVWELALVQSTAGRLNSVRNITAGDKIFANVQFCFLKKIIYSVPLEFFCHIFTDCMSTFHLISIV